MGTPQVSPGLGTAFLLKERNTKQQAALRAGHRPSDVGLVPAQWFHTTCVSQPARTPHLSAAWAGHLTPSQADDKSHGFCVHSPLSFLQAGILF